MDVEAWLSGLGLGEYAAAFAAHEVRLDDLHELTADDLREIGLPVGPRRRILVAAAAMAATRGPARPAEDGTGERSAAAERRRMSVVFCDLVGSTALSDQLEVEELHDLMGRYQDLVGEQISTHGGHVAKYLGDGLLAYFGWPEATEDQTERAVRAGLDVVRRVSALDVRGEALASRVGIATGEVVVGDLSGEQAAIVGRTANLAARLEGVADPGTVVADELTARLAAHEFEMTGPVTAELKGFDDPVVIYAVDRTRDVHSRFHAARASRLSPFVGRSAESALMRQAWERAVSGAGSVVAIGGDAGIGKSRLVHELVESAGVDERSTWRLQCSPAHTASVLHPVLRRIELAAELRSGVDTAGKLVNLARFLGDWPGETDEATALVAGYLGLGDPTESTHDPSQRRTRMLGLLLDRIVELGARSPLLVVFEDLHWSDPTTLELAQRLARRIRDRSILLVATHRPEFDVAEIGTDGLTALRLDRLPSHDVRVLLGSLLDDGVDGEIVDRVVERTDGNPLYVEELAPLATGLAGCPDDVPASLSASLVGQLDRLGSAKRAAQVAAVVGREFPVALVGELLGSGGSGDSLQPLFDAGLVLPGASDDDAVFKHALVRDAAYETLLKSERRTIHADIATRLESGDVSTGIEPEVIAQHWAAAEEWDRAVDHRLAAGRRASIGGAVHEARAHLLAALDLVRAREPGAARDRAELAILLDLAPATMALGGYAAAEVEEMYRRARALAEAVGDADQQLVARWGEYYVTEIQGHWHESETNVRLLLDLDTARLRPDLVIQIHHAAATLASATGDVRGGLEHARRAIDEYDRELHVSHRFLFGSHDPGVCALGQTACMLALRGAIADALESADAGVELAIELDHPPTTALALWMRVMTMETLDDPGVRRAIADTIAFCDEHRVGAVRKSVELRRLATLEDRVDAFRQFRARLEPMIAAGRSGFQVPQFAVFGAEAALDVGEVDDALRFLRFAEAAAHRSGELLPVGALLHQRGRALEAGSPRDVAGAIAAYRESVDFCAEREMHWVRLEPATALGRLLADRGDTVDAMDVVSDALAAVPADLDEPRVVRARRLLAGL